MAAALERPLVALFGDADVATWAPVSETSVVLKHGARVDLIAVDEVVAAAVELMCRGGAAGRGRPGGV